MERDRTNQESNYVKRIIITGLIITCSEYCIYSTSIFLDLLKSKKKADHKKATLLAYWIKDYLEYIKTEKSFQPDKLIRYKRGSIVQVEFGFRIGNELGGRHYAVVDKKNDLYSSTVTVVPLSSLKEKYKPNQYSFILKKGVFDLCTDKIQQSIDSISEQVKQLDEESTEKSLMFVEKRFR